MSNPLIPFLIRHCLAGVLAGWMFLGALLGLDLAGLRTLILAEAAWWLPLGMLAFGVAVTFGSAAMGAGIMGLGRTHPPAGSRAAGAGLLARLDDLASPRPLRTVPVRNRS